jgi:hypothetical protein
MSSILLGPIGPTAAEEGGGKRAARERVKSNLEKNLHLAVSRKFTGTVVSKTIIQYIIQYLRA